MPKRAENKVSWGAWFRFLLVVILLAAKAFLFDRMVALDMYVSPALAFFKWAAAVVLALAVMWTSKRWPVFVLLGLTDLWIIAQIIYFRVNHLFMTWHLFTLAGNMEGFWSSILPYWDASLLLYPLLTCVAAVCFLWKATPFRWWEALLALLIGAMISLSGSYLRWYYHKPFINGAPFDWKWINPCRVPQAFFVGVSENERKATHYIHHRSILAYPLFMVADCIQSYAERTRPAKLTDEEQALLATLVTLQTPPAPLQGNLVILLLESFESWVLDAKDASGDPVCPALNAYIRSHPVLYVRDVESQIQYGMSGDGQLLVNTGLYPTLEGIACIHYDYCTYPNIAHFYTHSAIVNPCRNVWNQRTMTTAYGYRYLIEPNTDYRFAWTDSTVTDRVMETITTLPVPSCVMGISINGHLPFDSSPDREVCIPDSVPEVIRNYMQTAHFTDRHVGRFLAWADTAQVMRNSTIVITGDHCIFSCNMSDEVREYGLRAGLPFGTDAAGCPLIIVSPHMRSRKVIEHAGQIDIFPTILDFIGQKSYFWKGFGRDLREADLSDETEDYLLHRSLSDKLIRTNYFKQ